MADLDIVGTAAVDVVPIVPTFNDKLKAAVLPIADKIGLQAGRALGDRMAEAMRGSLAGSGAGLGDVIGQTIGEAAAKRIAAAIQDGVTAGGRRSRTTAGRQGDETGGAFARSLKAKLEAAFRAMPKLDIGIADTGVDAQLARIRSKIEQLAGKRVGIDVTAEDAQRKVDELDAKLAALGATHPDVSVRMDTATARAALADFRAEVQAALADPAKLRVETDGSFGTKLRAAVQEAQASLPAVNVDANTDPAIARIQGLRAQLDELSTKRVGIDIDAATAIARVDEIKAQLDELGAKSADPAVRVDTAAASAQLAAVKAQLDDLNNKRSKISVDTSEASSAIMGLGMEVAALGAIPGAAILAAGIGSIAAAASAAGAGVGALALAAIPAIKGVGAALQAQTAAQNDVTRATNLGVNAAVAAQQHALQLASAEQAVATAKRTAAQQIQSATQQVAQAERSLADAQRSEKRAQTDLTTARAAAAQQLRDLSNQLADAALSERDATLQVRQAKLDLDATLANPKATELQREQAQLTYDQAVQHLKEQKQQTDDLQKSAAKQRKAGIDGNTQVVAAAEKLRQAQQGVIDAQQRVADATQKAAEAQVQAADSIASAERGLQSAQLSGEKVTSTATTKADQYRQALDKLSPSARALFDAIAGPQGLKIAFLDWSKALQPTVLPIFTRAVQEATNLLPQMTPFVKDAASALGTLENAAFAQAKTPFWQGFKADLQDAVVPAITKFGTAFGNIFTGIAGVIDAFLPHVTGVGNVLDGITGRFARWGQGLKVNPAFQSFLDYVKTNGPGMARLVDHLLSTIGSVLTATAPLSSTLYATLNPLLSGIQWLATNFPGVIQLAWGLYAAMNATKLAMIAINGLQIAYEAGIVLMTLLTDGWTAAIAAANVAFDANPIVIVIGVIIAALALVVGAVIYAYDHWTWFRTAVTACWDAIKTVALFAWTSTLKPTFEGMWLIMKTVGGWAMWLWNNALGPTFTAIWTGARVLFAIVVTAVLVPLLLAYKLMAAGVEWGWKTLVEPTFHAFAALGSWLYQHALKPAFDGISAVFRGVADVAQWLWNKAISPVFHWIADGASWLWNHGLKQNFEIIKAGIGLVGEAFGTAKDFIAKVWSQVSDVAKKPINFVIDKVYTHGIKAVWDPVADFVHLGHLPNAPKLLAAGGTVGDGWGPARPMKVNRPTAIVGEGDPRFPEYVIPTDPKYRKRALALHHAAGAQLMESGGILGSIWDTTKSAGTTVWDVAKDGADLLLHPGKIWDSLTSSIRGMLDKVGTYPFAKTIAQIPVKAIGGLKDLLLQFVGAGGGSGNFGQLGGGAGVKRWTPQVLQALQLLGQPSSWLDTVLRRMNQESGGNATIVNTTDSNWLAGTPSVGLMQVIGPTFRAYAGKFLGTGPFEYGTSVNPLANIFAGLNYALHRYGSLAALNRPGGYATGGFPAAGELAWVGEDGPELVRFLAPAQVYSHADSTRMTSQLSTVPARGAGDVYLEARVFVGDREITDIVRTEIHTHESNTAANIYTGRRL